MPNIQLSAEEKKQLNNIHSNIRSSFPLNIQLHFNKAGKYQEFCQAPTAQETEERMKCGAEIASTFLSFNQAAEDKMTMASLRNTDIFLSIARRVGNDADLATILKNACFAPKQFSEKDVALLQKCEMKSLATLIQKNL